MLGVVAIPAGVGIAGLLTVGLTALAASLVLYGLLKAYQFSLGALIQTLSEHVRGIKWVGGRIADALDSMDDAVVDAIGKGILATEQASARFFHGVMWIWDATIDSIADLAAATTEAITGLTDGEIPRQVREQTRPLTTTVGQQGTWARARDKALAKQMATGIDRLHKDLLAEQLAREKGIDAIGAKVTARVDGIADRLAGEIAGVRSWAGEHFRGIDARLSGVNRFVGTAAATGAVLLALDRVFPWYKCRNVRRFNAGLCRGNPDALLGLLALGALGAGLADPRAIARAGQETTEALEALFRELAGLAD